MNQILSNNSFITLNYVKITLALLVSTLLFSGSKAVASGPLITPNTENTIYVNSNATGDGSGSTWTNAIPDLAVALKWASQNYNTN